MSNKIRMLPDNWTYGDYYNFVLAFNSGNTREAFRLARKLIMSWDYKTDLNQENPIGKLGVSESAEVIRTVFEVIGKYIETLDIKEVKVSFDAWDTDKFLEFDEWKRTGKFERTEPMLKDVVIWDKLTEAQQGDEPLPFTVAATCYQAINKAYEKVVSGKN